MALLLATSFFLPRNSFAWSAKGHQLVAQVAFHYLDDSTKERVMKYLGKMSIEEASTWMDDMRSNDYYTYMRPWHYIDVEKGKEYSATAADRNILIILNSAIEELRNMNDHKFKGIRNDLFILFHLVGDLHQPLHTGYPEDKGGNTTYVPFLQKSNSLNLHGIWDDAIISTKNITLEDCLKQYDTYTTDEINAIQQVNVLSWFHDSRLLLDNVYGYKNNFIDQQYVDESAEIIKKQILKAGLRLAAVLKETFKA